MLEEEDLDGICIVTPNESHFGIAVEAAKLGIHVMCEKPLAMDHNEARSMLEAAERNNIIHGVNFTYRENPGVKKMKELLAQGLIGKVYEGTFQYTGAYGLAGPPGWRGYRSLGGKGGVLADLGSHLIDLVQFVLGEKICSVYSSLSCLHEGKLKRIQERQEHDQSADSAFLHGSFPDGIQALFYTSWISHQGNKNQTIKLSLFGSEGAIQFSSSELGTKLRFAEGKNPWRSFYLEGVDQWDDSAEPSEERFRPWRLTKRNEIWKWVDLILEREGERRLILKRIPTFQDGYEVQKVIDAVIQSAEQRREIVIGEEGAIGE